VRRPDLRQSTIFGTELKAGMTRPDPRDEQQGMSSTLTLRQVETLVRALRRHQVLLDGAHWDARRLLVSGRRPAYVLSAGTLFSYMFPSSEHPEWQLELSFLFERSATQFYIGPGALTELDGLLHAANSQLTSAQGTEVTGPGVIPATYIHGLSEDRLRVGIARVARLVRSSNCRLYSQLVDPPSVDEKTYDVARAILDRTASRLTEGSKLSDALDWAAVVYLRRRLAEVLPDAYPYLLLTEVSPLHEALVGREEEPVARRADEAIYSEVLLDLCPDPAEAQRHTVEISFQAAIAERELRSAPAYGERVALVEEAAPDARGQSSLPDDGPPRLFAEVAEFVRDPVVRETQRIYDNLAALAAGDLPRDNSQVEALPPGMVFDLVAALDAELRHGRSRGLEGIWTSVLEVRSYRRGSRTIYEVCDRGSDATAIPYLVIEAYSATAADQRDQFVARWPSSLDAATILAAFSSAFERHGVAAIGLAIGTYDKITQWQTETPVTLADVSAFLEKDRRGDPRGDMSGGDMRWISISAPPFTLYADITPLGLASNPVISVSSHALDASWIASLYRSTSGRYLVPTWLADVLDVIWERVGLK
jgi:hypothetical protein